VWGKTFPPGAHFGRYFPRPAKRNFWPKVPDGPYLEPNVFVIGRRERPRGGCHQEPLSLFAEQRRAGLACATPQRVRAGREVMTHPQAASRSSGQWSDEDYDVLADGKVIGRIYEARRPARHVTCASGTAIYATPER
jgi:hypothetical protein